MVSTRHRISFGVALLAVLMAAGVVGYVLVEGWSVLDALYMTLITFTTVGFQEVHSLSRSGRVFTIFLMIAGVATMVYVLSAMMQAIVEGEALKRFVQGQRMRTRLSGERDHYILCGFGRVGKEVASSFLRSGNHFIVVDPDFRAIAEADEMGYAYVQGNATEDSVLDSAGIARAQGLVAVAGSDSDNVFISLSARELNPELHIVARTSDLSHVAKLKRAGVDQVISPFAVGGRQIALSAARPQVSEFMDSLMENLGDFRRLTVVRVQEGSPLDGTAVGASSARLSGVILFLRRSDGETLLLPHTDTTLRAGDSLVTAVPDDSDRRRN